MKKRIAAAALMLVTALAPEIGHDQTAQVAKLFKEESRSIL